MITHHEPSRIRANQGESAVSNYHESWITTDHYRTFRIITHRRAISITVMTIMGMCGQPSPGTSWSVSGSNLTLVALVNIQILGQWMSNGCSSPVCLRYLVKWYQLPDLSHFGISCHFYLASEKELKKDEKSSFKTSTLIVNICLDGWQILQRIPPSTFKYQVPKKRCALCIFFGSLYVNSVLDCYGY